RNRFAGGRAPDDEAWLRRQLRSLPQLSDPVARLDGEGTRAGSTADHVAAALEVVSGRVWRHTTAGRACGAGTDARDRVPPVDAQDCREDSAVTRCQSLGHWRGRWSGRIPDAREPPGDW